MTRSQFIALITGILTVPFLKKRNAECGYATSTDGITWTKCKPEDVRHFESVRWAEENSEYALLNEDPVFIEFVRDGKWTEEGKEWRKNIAQKGMKKLWS